MKPFEPIEEELRKHDPGWWDRVVHAIPELSSLGETPQPERHHAEGDVAQHTRLAVESCPPDCDNDLLWAALLHDAGKPSVTKEKGGKITAHGHHKVGAEIAEKILRRLEMATERSERIVWVIKNHMFHLFWNIKCPEDASKRHRRFVADPRFPLLLELLRVDSIASLGSRKMAAHILYSRLRNIVVSEKDKLVCRAGLKGKSIS
ncbi:MAG: HD domain-containing protein [Thermodesulfobacteriota bacterium]|nr:HD domain-containing protein [Thermodesulfobacteriota bacterium]